MRIGFVVPRCHPTNSHGRYVIELAQRFARSEEVTVYSGAFWPDLDRGVHRKYLPILDWPMLARLSSAWMSSASIGMGDRHDIVHVQGADAPVGNVATAHCCTAAMHAASGDVALHRRVNHLVGAHAERYALGKSSTRSVIAVSQKVRREIEQQYRVPPAKVTVVPPGVDVKAFHPDNRGRWRAEVRAELGLGDGDVAVLYAGGNYRLKGLLPLIEAVRRVGHRVKLMALGVALDTRLALATRGIERQVAFVSLTPDIARYYAAADCFALPTRYDTFSLVTLEAMATGLPVMVSTAAGISDLLTDGHDALLLRDPVTVDALADCLQRICEDAALRAALGEQARRTAERYSWSQVAVQVADVYRRTVAAA